MVYKIKRKKLKEKKQQMIYFYDSETRKILAGISQEGLVDGEIKSTKELLSYEKNIPISRIKIKIERI